MSLSEVVHWISADPNSAGNITGCGKPFVFPMRGTGWRVRAITCPDCDRAICDIVHAIADRNPKGGDVKQAPSHSDESGGAEGNRPTAQ
jgi:hypothetical protein